MPARSSSSAARPRVRPANAGDAVRIRDLHVASIRRLAGSHYTPTQIAAWSGGRKPSQYRKAMEAGEAMWVAEKGGRVVGFASFLGEELRALFVHPRDAGRGVGSALLAVVERQAARRSLRAIFCLASLNALSFYRARGFRAGEGGSLCFGNTPIAYVHMWKKL